MDASEALFKGGSGPALALSHRCWLALLDGLHFLNPAPSHSCHCKESSFQSWSEALQGLPPFSRLIKSGLPLLPLSNTPGSPLPVLWNCYVGPLLPCPMLPHTSPSCLFFLFWCDPHLAFFEIIIQSQYFSLPFPPSIPPIGPFLLSSEFMSSSFISCHYMHIYMHIPE